MHNIAFFYVTISVLISVISDGAFVHWLNSPCLPDIIAATPTVTRLNVSDGNSLCAKKVTLHSHDPHE